MDIRGIIGRLKFVYIPTVIISGVIVMLAYSLMSNQHEDYAHRSTLASAHIAAAPLNLIKPTHLMFRHPSVLLVT